MFGCAYISFMYITPSETLKMEVGGHRKIGRPKLRWSDVISKDMKEKGVTIEERHDRRT